MASDLLQALCALAMFGLPLGVAWLIVWCGDSEKNRKHKD